MYRSIANYFLCERYAPGQVVYRQGDSADAIYFVLDGAIDSRDSTSEYADCS